VTAVQLSATHSSVAARASPAEQPRDRSNLARTLSGADTSDRGRQGRRTRDFVLTRYQDRRHAGRVLAAALREYEGARDVVILAIPRGGVPVAYEIATRLGAPLDVFVVRKLGVPGHEELAMGAIASGGVTVFNRNVIEKLGIPEAALRRVTAAERAELERREQVYREGRPPLDLTEKTCILVDDGLATGSTMRAAVAALRQRRARSVVVAVPIAAPTTCEELGYEADDVVCAATPEPFVAVGLWYADFAQTTDDEVRELLAAAARNQAPRDDGSAPSHAP
jgi:putative phosphoribosyl transferase